MEQYASCKTRVEGVERASFTNYTCKADMAASYSILRTALCFSIRTPKDLGPMAVRQALRDCTTSVVKEFVLVRRNEKQFDVLFQFECIICLTISNKSFLSRDYDQLRHQLVSEEYFCLSRGLSCVRLALGH